MNRSLLRLGFLLNALALAVAWLAPSQLVYAQCPQICDGSSFNTAFGINALPGDSGAGNTAIGSNVLFNNAGFNNTAIGEQALFSNTTGVANTAIGFDALLSNTTGADNTATGAGALWFNTTGSNNTANGFLALVFNNGSDNTATGYLALYRNTTGSDNTANGAEALSDNTTGAFNTAIGFNAMLSNTQGDENTATGLGALLSNTVGNSNTAYGTAALTLCRIGNNNTAVGGGALQLSSSGNENIALGYLAGFQITTGSRNIDIGHMGQTNDSGIIRIGTKRMQTNTYIAGISGITVAGGVGVIVDTNGHLGTVVSSERFKDAIKPMDKASEAILALYPVTFRYKHDLDPDGIPQFGLVAEEVEKVNPDLVARDEQGKPYTVRYEAVNAMLLNEFLKEHKAFVEAQHKIEKLETTVGTLVATVNEQSAQIRKVTLHLEINKSTPEVVMNKP